jgi:N-methylhydantoinase A/oxoprolinase/acetone carboxylase beta subunit
MPDILSIALGGGSVVRSGAVGPDSVGYRIAEEALVFGGGTATLTDAAVAGGRLPRGVSGWRERLEAVLAEREGTERMRAGRGSAGRGSMGDMSEYIRDTLQRALAVADELALDAVDRMTLGRADRPLVAVGGGAFLLPERIPGASRVIRPEHAAVANAVGAAIALASGRVDTIMHAGESRSKAIERVKEEAVARAVAAGADPAGVQIVDLLEVPLSYLSEPAVRVHVKAAGPLTR